MLYQDKSVTDITVTNRHSLKTESGRQVFQSLTPFVGKGTVLQRAIVTAVASSFLAACGVGGSGEESDPVVVDQAVAYIKRPLLFEDDEQTELQEDDLSEPALFRPGAVLYLKERASASASSVDITSVAFSDPSFLNEDGELLYDVRDLDVSHDGTKIIFSMRAPEIEDADDEDQPKWDIWEYDTSMSSLRRIIDLEDVAQDGHDLSPTYLPDDRILFTSTRQRTSKAVLLDEGKGQFSGLDEDRGTEAFTLHVMNPDGTDIEQITFNQSHDVEPIVLPNGKILFSRWDNAGQTSANGMNLYQVNPDGTELSYLYGRHSHDSGDEGRTVEFAQPRVLDNQDVVVELRELQSTGLGGQPTIINFEGYVEHNVGVDGTVFDADANPGQSALVEGISTRDALSLEGSYGSFFPLYDGTNRYLASWSPCRIIDTTLDLAEGESAPIEVCTQAKLDSGNYEAANPLFGLWVVDVSNDTQLPIELPEEGSTYDEAVLVTTRDRPTYIPPLDVSDTDALVTEGLGVVHIRSVYDFDGVDTSTAGIAATADSAITPAANREARFVRIEKPASIPSDEVRDIDNTAYGRSRAQLMREILGYAPVEPDGSVMVAVPANVAFAISVLNEAGERITPRHQNWLQVKPGERIECIGCHTAGSEVPHGRYDAQPAAANAGAPTTGVPFANTLSNFSPDMGETMAEVYVRTKDIEDGLANDGDSDNIRRLTPEIIYDDEWTDPAGATVADSFSYAYSGDGFSTPAPITASCASNWTSSCRIVINYETHIHPLWSVDRQQFDADDVLIEDQTCTSCHTSADADDMPIVAEAHLDLTDGPSTDEADHFKSYRELLFNDNEQEVVDGILQDRMEETGQFNEVPQFDEEGEPILDEDGEQVIVLEPILAPVPVAASMRVAGSRNSTAFWAPFQAGQSHEGYLTDDEIKLIAEWLDLGAQYYNNPFDAPAN